MEAAPLQGVRLGVSQGFKQKETFSKAEILHKNFWFLSKSWKMWGQEDPHSPESGSEPGRFCPSGDMGE